MYQKLMWLRERSLLTRAAVVGALLLARVVLFLRAPGDPTATVAGVLTAMAAGALLCRWSAAVVAVAAVAGPWLLHSAMTGSVYGGFGGLLSLLGFTTIATGIAHFTQVMSDRAGILDMVARVSRERFMLVDKAGRLVVASESALDSVQGPRLRVGQPVIDSVASGFRPVAEEMLQAVLRGETLQQTPIQVIKRGGKSLPLVLTARPVRYRGDTYVLGVTSDVTGPEPTQRLFSAGFDSTDIGIAFRSTDGSVIWCNQAFADMAGLSKSEIIGTRAAPFGGTAHLEDIFGILKRTGKPVRRELATRDGRMIEISASPIQNADKSLYATITFLTDITQRKQAEARMVQAERLAAVGQLAAGMAHNLNNVLGAIAADAEVLTLLGDQQVAAVAGEILGAVEHGSTMIRNLYELAGRRQAPALRPLKAAATVDATVRQTHLQADALGVTVAVNVAPELEVSADEHQLRQVLVNLVLNSLQAMPRGGELRIAAAPDGAGKVLLTVADNGCGIPPEHMERLFEPFFTTKGATNGTGLGLATSRAMVRAMGGDIRISSVPGVGTTVTIELGAA